MDVVFYSAFIVADKIESSVDDFQISDGVRPVKSLQMCADKRNGLFHLSPINHTEQKYITSPHN